MKINNCCSLYILKTTLTSIKQDINELLCIPNAILQEQRKNASLIYVILIAKVVQIG